MFTSYFANLSKVSNPLSICGKAPVWYLGPQFRVLAPKFDFFSAYKQGELDEAGYTEQFKLRVLAPLDPAEVYECLVQKYGHDVTLLCYEKPGDFCHRHLVAEWFETSLGVKVQELSVHSTSPLLMY